MTALGGMCLILRTIPGKIRFTEARTRGNLEPDEERVLRQVLTELRLNYVDELKKSGGAVTSRPGGSEKPAGETISALLKPSPRASSQAACTSAAEAGAPFGSAWTRK